MTSLYSVTREDLYDYLRCPKIVSIKAYQTLRGEKRAQTPPQRAVEPATVGMIGEAAVQLGFSGAGIAAAMKQISYSIPELNRNQLLKQIAIESLSGVEKIRVRLRAEYGEITIIGKGQGRQPDLAGTVLPDRIAFSSESRIPIIVEVKNSRYEGPADKFQGKFYNGVAETSGLYLLEERLEERVPKLAPRMIHGEAETILVYPRLAASKIIKEKFVPTRSMIKKVWSAKQLGLKGFAIETNCEKNCPHYRLKVELPEGSMEPLTPLPLVFSKGMIDEKWDLDMDYQVRYGWKMLPRDLRLILIMGGEKVEGKVAQWKQWLMHTVGLDEDAAEITLNFKKRHQFLTSKPNTNKLKSTTVLDHWKKILKKRLETSAPAIIGRATAVYSLPKQSAKFVEDTWERFS